LKKVNKYSFANHTIHCTPNHKILTKEFGFLEAEKINSLIPTCTITLCVFAENKIKWKRILSSITVQDSQDTQMLKEVSNYEKVYDLQIENNHEYFANNILVHNCSDLTEYLICYAFQNEYANYQRGGTPTNFTLGRNVAKNSYK
jgi:hypothetical protein